MFFRRQNKINSTELNKVSSIVLGTHSKALNLYQDNFSNTSFLYQPSSSLTVRKSLNSFISYLFISASFRYKLLLKTSKTINSNKFYYWGEIYLNSYVLEELVLFTGYISKNKEKSFYIANHYDRWVVMLDSLNVNYTILQHGRLTNLDLPYRLNCLVGFYYQDRISLKTFKFFIKSNKINTVKFNHLSVKLNLTDVNEVVETSKLTLLYIGEPHLRKFEEKILFNLIKDDSIYLLYKSHPRFKSVNFIFEPCDNFLRVKQDCYPNVDLVIYIGSTLGFEYESTGNEVIKISGVLDKDTQKIKEIIQNKKTN